MDYTSISKRVEDAVTRTDSMHVPARQRSGYIAALAGCVPFGKDSAYAQMVAHPIDNPDIVVKVCGPKDGFVLYALMCLHGHLVGPEYLRVYSAARVGHSWVFVTERLDEHNLAYARCDSLSLFQEEMIAKLCKVAESFGVVHDDLHRNNVMRRGEQLVVLDPWGRATFELDDEDKPIKETPLQEVGCTNYEQVVKRVQVKMHLQNPAFLRGITHAGP